MLTTIGQIPEDAVLITDSQEVEHVMENIGFSETGYDSLFVKLDSSGADYEKVWGFMGCVPYLSKLARLIYPPDPND